MTKLKGLAKNAEMVWLASDEDREGEAISWHLAEELKLKPEKQNVSFFTRLLNQLFKKQSKIREELITI